MNFQINASSQECGVGMLAFAIDSSNRLITAVLMDQKRGVIGSVQDSHEKHSAILMELIHRLFTDNKKNISDVENIIFANGPGGFTSLRVGLATIAGVFFARRVKVYPVSSLFLRLKSMMNSRNLPSVWLHRAGAQVFYAGWQNHPVRPNGEAYCRLQDVQELLQDLPPGALLAGEGVDALNPEIVQNFKIVCREDALSPFVFNEVWPEISAGSACSLSEIQLNYIRPGIGT